jgi:hypothetical protein
MSDMFGINDYALSGLSDFRVFIFVGLYPTLNVFLPFQGNLINSKFQT